MRKILKKAGPLLMILGLILAISVTAMGAEKKKRPIEGTCGKEATWKYNKDSKALIIEGKGTITGDEEWWYLDIKEVKIKNGIKKIGAYAFCELEQLKSVAIPDSVKVIGKAAFNESGITSATIGKNVKKIGPAVFAYCYKLKEVKWSADTIPEDTFYSCKRLTHLKIKSNIKSIGSYALSQTSIKSFDMPNSVKSIGEGVFAGNKKMKKVKLSSKITEIPKKTFYNTPKLKKIVMKEGITTIGSNAFYKSGIEQVVIPNSVTDIKKKAFSNAENLKEIKLSDAMKSIKEKTFEDCINLKTIIFGKKIAVIGENAFEKCQSLTTVNIPGSVKNIEYEAFKNAGCEKVTIGEGVRNIDYWAFTKCKKLKEISISSSVTTLQTNALANCPLLSTITVSSANPKYMVIDNCLVGKDSLTLLVVPGAKAGTFTIPDRIEKISPEAWRGCKKITNFNVGKDTKFKVIDGFLCDATGTELLAAPQGRTGSINIPKGIVKICESAFQSSKASFINIPSTVTTLETSAFEYCNNITEITIPGSVYQISGACFWECSNLKRVTVENGVSKIWRNTFYGCKKLKRVELPNSLTLIHKTAFSECSYRLKLYCKKNSLAMAYATKNYFDYRII